jgi:hypothetical protein
MLRWLAKNGALTVNYLKAISHTGRGILAQDIGPDPGSARKASQKYSLRRFSAVVFWGPVIKHRWTSIEN